METANTFEVVELMSVPGRMDRLVVLKVLSGSPFKVKGNLNSPQAPGNWRVTSALTSQSPDPSRVAVGLEGPAGLAPGMLLEDSE